mmetsp:Transcript_45547/g.113114  ORF Transcript_45547/g.113114 Transcript_45547/m.113114 type:complete len:215 (-) Transcript_45547:110-754(-)
MECGWASVLPEREGVRVACGWASCCCSCCCSGALPRLLTMFLMLCAHWGISLGQRNMTNTTSMADVASDTVENSFSAPVSSLTDLSVNHRPHTRDRVSQRVNSTRNSMIVLLSPKLMLPIRSSSRVSTARNLSSLSLCCSAVRVGLFLLYGRRYAKRSHRKVRRRFNIQAGSEKPIHDAKSTGCAVPYLSFNSPSSTTLGGVPVSVDEPPMDAE